MCHEADWVGYEEENMEVFSGLEHVDLLLEKGDVDASWRLLMSKSGGLKLLVVRGAVGYQGPKTLKAQYILLDHSDVTEV